LSALGCDTLEILLGRSIGIADLKEETLFTNGLTMELLDDLFADIATLEAGVICQSETFGHGVDVLPSEANTPTVVLAVTKNSAGANSVIHEDSTKFLLQRQYVLRAENVERGPTDSVMFFGRFET
jgi:hypothetical protein